jgi:hypothetical protein
MAERKGQTIVETPVEARGAERGPTVRNILVWSLGLMIVAMADGRRLVCFLSDMRALIDLPRALAFSLRPGERNMRKSLVIAVLIGVVATPVFADEMVFKLFQLAPASR